MKKKLILLTCSLIGLLTFANSVNNVVRAEDNTDYTQNVDTSTYDGENWIYTTDDDYKNTYEEELNEMKFNEMVEKYAEYHWILDEVCLKEGGNTVDCSTVNWKTLIDELKEVDEEEKEMFEELFEILEQYKDDLVEAWQNKAEEYGWNTGEDNT